MIVDGTQELIECFDIFMAAVDYTAETEAHNNGIVALLDYYENPPESVDLDDWREEYQAQMHTLFGQAPHPDFTEDELVTALWQSVSLGMTLLFDHMQLIDVVKGNTPLTTDSGIVTPDQGLVLP